mgnify:FL=1|jgi:hypothetical protein
MVFRHALIGFFAILVSHTSSVDAALSSGRSIDDSQGSVSSPLSPKYVIDQHGYVTLRICYNWSCARRETMTFTPDDMDLLRSRMALCPGTSLEDRLQRVRIGIWQMESLAQKYQPVLANDHAINKYESELIGRMDCVDNASNTTTYLQILRDIGELAGWTVSTPEVRDRFNLRGVHWTAVITDKESELQWSVDSWFRPNSHLPLVMPLQSWIDEKKAWEPPFARINHVPDSIHELCTSRSEPALLVD